MREQSMQVPKLLADHLRWMVVLAQLREIGGKEHRYPVRQLVGDLQLSNLFPGTDGKIDREPVVGLTKKGWEIWFCGKSVDKGESPLNSIYQCRSFYGLDAPNNLLQRLNKLLDIAIDRHKTIEPEARRGKKDSKYDRYVEQWGEYALRLVWLNGGWESFSSKRSLAEIQDLWLGVNPPGEMMGDARESLIQRIIYLDCDRYIQIVTTPMGSLYPLWFFKSQARKELLDLIAIGDRGMKKALPKRDLYIDVNSQIGMMAGLPYPFGVADEMLAYCWDLDLAQVGNLLTETAWQPMAIQAIARELQNEYWSPPLLFTLWGDEFPLPDDDKHNYAIPLIALTQGGDRFGELYQKIATLDRPLTELSIGIEPATYGEKILDRVASQGVKISAQIDCSRTQILTQSLNIDLIASYFPISLLLEIDPNYQQLSTAQLYQSWGKIGDAFNYNPPQLVLAGGMFLARQAKAIDLVIDLASYLHTVELFIRYLRPEWDSIERYFSQLASNNRLEKQAAAQAIADACRVVGKKSKLVKGGDLVSANAIAEIFTEVAIEMVTALMSTDSEHRQICLEQIDDWGWAKLLESVQSTAVYIACELFTG